MWKVIKLGPSILVLVRHKVDLLCNKAAALLYLLYYLKIGSDKNCQKELLKVVAWPSMVIISFYSKSTPLHLLWPLDPSWSLRGTVSPSQGHLASIHLEA